MRSWLIAIYFFSDGLFFGTLGLLSLTHTEESSVYTVYMLLFFLVIGFVWSIAFMKKSLSLNKKIQVSKIVIVSLLMIIGFSLIVQYFVSGSEVVLTILKYFASLVVPATLISMSAREKDVVQLVDRVKYINIYLSICFVIAFLKNSSGGISGFGEIGGATHLTIGFTMATLFSFNYFKLTTTKGLFRKAYYLLLSIMNASFILFSGSRGALVGVCIVFIVATYIYVVRKRKTIRFLLVSTVLILIGMPFIKSLNLEDALFRFSLTFSGDLETASAGRSTMYSDIWGMFLENPIFGNGIASYAINQGFYIMPHQLFLEILNDFGVIGALILAPLLIILLKKLLWILKQPVRSIHFVAFLFVNVFVSLMFSGSYLVNMKAWIIIVLILVMTKDNIRNISLNDQSDIGKSSNTQLMQTVR